MTSSAPVRRARRAFELLLACACVALFLASPRLTFAQGGPSSGTSPEGYKLLIEQALLEFRHKNWPEARILFRRAHELSPSARTFRGLGVVSYEMRDYVQAVRDLGAALTDGRQPLSAEQRSEAETLLSRARTFVAVYTLVVEPATAPVTVDGAALLRETDGTILLSFGEHTLSASLEGYETARAQVSVQGGERGEVTLNLVPQFVDMKAVATESQPEEPPSERALSAAEPPSEQEMRGGLRYTWVALASGAAFGGAAAAFWFIGEKKLDDLDAKCATAADSGRACSAANTDTDEVQRFELFTNISLGAAAAAVLATGIVAYFEWPRSSEHRVSVGLGPTSLSVRGAF